MKWATSYRAAYPAKPPSLTFAHPPIICPKSRGPGKQGLYCFASCLAAAPLRGARCRPGSERVKAAGRDKGLGGGARFPHCLPQCLTPLASSGGLGPSPRMPPDPVPRLQPPSRSSGPPGSSKPSALPSRRPPYPASRTQPASMGPALSLPAAPDRPPPGLSSPAAPPGTEPGVRAAASRGQGRSRSPRAPPAGPNPPRHPPGPGSPPRGRPALTGRRSPPGRQQELRRGIQRPRPGPGWSAARRGAAPPPRARASRASRRLPPAGGWRHRRPPA